MQITYQNSQGETVSVPIPTQNTKSDPVTTLDAVFSAVKKHIKYEGLDEDMSTSKIFKNFMKKWNVKKGVKGVKPIPIDITHNGDKVHVKISDNRLLYVVSKGEKFTWTVTQTKCKLLECWKQSKNAGYCRNHTPVLTSKLNVEAMNEEELLIFKEMVHRTEHVEFLQIISTLISTMLDMKHGDHKIFPRTAQIFHFDEVFDINMLNKLFRLKTQHSLIVEERAIDIVEGKPMLVWRDDEEEEESTLAE